MLPLTLLVTLAPQDLKAPDIGTAAPAFTLTDTTGKEHSLADFKGKYVVLEWTNDGCPFVKKHYESGNMQRYQGMAAKEDIVWLSIVSSAEGKQGYVTPERGEKIRADWKMASTATLLDPSGAVGKLYGAKTTPHMYVINPDGSLIYEGGIDDGSDDLKTAKNYVWTALTEARAGKAVSTPRAKPYGCSVKYAD